MKVTIITTCRNRSGTIADALESVAHQDYPDLEHIVIDGASTDGTQSIIEQHRAGLARYISEPDNGMYEAINKGIRLSTGDVIGLLHSDDMFYATDTITQLVRELERTEADLVYGNGVFVKANDVDFVVRDWISGSYQQDNVRRGWLPLHTTVFIRRNALHQVGLYNEQYKISADTDWLLRCLYEQHLRVVYLNDYVVRMRMGGASTNWQQTWHKWQEDYAIYKQHKLGNLVPQFLKYARKIPQFVTAWTKRKLNQYKPLKSKGHEPETRKIADATLPVESQDTEAHQNVG